MKGLSRSCDVVCISGKVNKVLSTVLIGPWKGTVRIWYDMKMHQPSSKVKKFIKTHLGKNTWQSDVSVNFLKHSISQQYWRKYDFLVASAVFTVAVSPILLYDMFMFASLLLTAVGTFSVLRLWALNEVAKVSKSSWKKVKHGQYKNSPFETWKSICRHITENTRWLPSENWRLRWRKSNSILGNLTGNLNNFRIWRFQSKVKTESFFKVKETRLRILVSRLRGSKLVASKYHSKSFWGELILLCRLVELKKVTILHEMRRLSASETYWSKILVTYVILSRYKSLYSQNVVIHICLLWSLLRCTVLK